MAEQVCTGGARFRIRLLAICAAGPAAVVAGLVTVAVLDRILPHGKDWQLPVIFLSAFLVGGINGVQCMRRIARELSEPHRIEIERLTTSAVIDH